MAKQDSHTRSPDAAKSVQLDAVASKVKSRVNGLAFSRWYHNRIFRQNIREGKEYFNGPSSIPPTDRHSPSSLLQCHRKIKYRQENAPEETQDADGILWTGSQIEEELYLPFLEDTVATENTYVRNSMWIDSEVETASCVLQIRGVTDPVIVDEDGNPLLPTELKSTTSLEYKESPNAHHRAQLHAYLYGLSEKYDQEFTEGLLVYISRETLELKSFHIEFDEEFWEKTVVEWATAHTEYRVNSDLPPPTPEFDWECKFCSYRERCGKGSAPCENLGSQGFVPNVEYPREKVLQYVQSQTDAKLTPTLASEFPEIAEDVDVIGWMCPDCSFSTTRTDPKQVREAAQPLCPDCADSGALVELREQVDTDQEADQ